MRLAFKPSAATGVSETYEFQIDGMSAHICVRDGEFTTGTGSAENPAVVVTVPTGVLLALVARRLSPAEALRRGAVKLRGSREAFARFIAMFEMPAPAVSKRKVR
jgi:hypothetical protein